MIFLTGLLLLCSACQKERNTNESITPLPDAWAGPQKYGWVKAKRNNQDWEGSGIWAYTYGDSTQIGLLFGTVDLDTVAIEGLDFVRIPLKVGKYKLLNSNQSPRSIYWIGYYDETDAFYTIDEARNNHLWIDSYDPVKKEIKGRFQVHFFRTESHVFNYPEEVSFENGEFEVSLLK